MPQVKDELDKCIADEEAKKKAMEDALADEMNIHKKINQTKENINQIRFKLHEAEEKLGIHIPKATAYVTSFLKYSIN